MVLDVIVISFRVGNRLGLDSEMGDEVVTVVTVEFAVVGDGDGDVDEVFGISVLADIIWHKHTVFNFSQRKKKRN